LLKISSGGGGFRPLLSHRAPFLNCLNSILPLCLNPIAPDGVTINSCGFWNSLGSILGLESFHPANEDNRWNTFFTSGSQYGIELKNEWLRLQDIRKNLLLTLPLEDQQHFDLKGPLISNANGFGKNIRSKISKKIFDSINEIRYISVSKRALLLPRNDPRRLSFLSSSTDEFSRSVVQASPDKSIKFSHLEFREAITTYFGLPSPICSSVIGEKIKNNVNSPQLSVDAYGFNLKTVTGATGDHIRTFHDSIVAVISNSLTEAAISHRGGFHRTCKNFFSHLLQPTNNLSTENIRHLQGIIPDLCIDATRIISEMTEESLFGKRTLVDIKTLAPGTAYSESPNIFPQEAVNKRASAVNAQYHRHAQSLDSNIHGSLPGSTGPIEKELNSYGHNGRVLGACVGSFSECSLDIHLIRDFIAHCLGIKMMDVLDFSYPEAISIFKRKISRRWGLSFAQGWSRVLLNRRRDLVNASVNHQQPSEDYTSSSSSNSPFSSINPDDIPSDYRCYRR
jgi:hypothetical protein